MSKVAIRVILGVGLLLLMMYFTVSNVMAISEPPNEVDITIDGESISVSTTDKVVEDVLDSVGYVYNDTDKLNYELDDRVLHEMEIVVNSEKEVYLSERGDSSIVKTNASTVEELLKESEIELSKDDIVIPSMNSKLSEADEVAIIYYKEDKYKKNSKIKFDVEKKFSSKVKFGETVVKQKGKNGEKESTYKEVTKNDVVLSDKKVSEKIITEPVTEKIVIGTKEKVESPISNKTITNENSSMYQDETKVIEEGNEGVRTKIYHNDGETRKLISNKITKEPVDKVVEKGTKNRPKETKSSNESTESTKTSAKYTLSQFKFNGVVHDGGRKFTYYSQSVLPGGGLSIPGRHVSSAGYVSDKDGYIVVASNRSISKGTVIDTPFGSKGKVYDICASCDSKWFDIYTE